MAPDGSYIDNGRVIEFVLLDLPEHVEEILDVVLLDLVHGRVEVLVPVEAELLEAVEAVEGAGQDSELVALDVEALEVLEFGELLDVLDSVAAQVEQGEVGLPLADLRLDLGDEVVADLEALQQGEIAEEVGGQGLDEVGVEVEHLELDEPVDFLGERAELVVLQVQQLDVVQGLLQLLLREHLQPS